MDRPPAFLQDLARRLLAIEAASGGGVEPHVHEAVRVCLKLQFCVTRLAGLDGFTSLLRRALALAGADVPSVRTLKLEPDCSLKGLEALAADATNGESEPAVAIIAHLLGLLVTFIGEPLTLRLVREAWPDALVDK